MILALVRRILHSSLEGRAKIYLYAKYMLMIFPYSRVLHRRAAARQPQAAYPRRPCHCPEHVVSLSDSVSVLCVPHQFSYPFGEDLDPKNECLTENRSRFNLLQTPDQIHDSVGE
jgi:hypothetical protein